MQQAATLNRYLTSAEVAEAIGVSTATMQRWRRLGLGPTYSRVGRRPRYSTESVQEWMASQVVVTTEDPDEVE